MAETSTTVSEPELPSLQIPTIGVSLPLSVAEIRWCMSQKLGLQATEPILGTRGAIDRFDELAREFNRHCSGRHYSQADGEEATKLVDATREAIVAAAIENIQQLNDRALTARIQDMLELLGFDLTIDGDYGPKTKEAIQTFQLRVGMPADGLVSQRLLDRLMLTHMRYVAGRERARGPVE